MEGSAGLEPLFPGSNYYLDTSREYSSEVDYNNFGE